MSIEEEFELSDLQALTLLVVVMLAGFTHRVGTLAMWLAHFFGRPFIRSKSFFGKSSSCLKVGSQPSPDGHHVRPLAPADWRCSACSS